MSGSDRIGALDFQLSASEYIPRVASSVSIEMIADALRGVDEGGPLPAELDAALLHGTSVGGARPKALVTSGERASLVKFSASTFLVSEQEARAHINELVEIVHSHWRDVADEADLSIADRKRLWDKAICNPFCFDGWSN